VPGTGRPNPLPQGERGMEKKGRGEWNEKGEGNGMKKERECRMKGERRTGKKRDGHIG